MFVDHLTSEALMSGMAEAVMILDVFRRRLRLQHGEEIGEAARNTAETAAALDLARQLLQDTRQELARATRRLRALSPQSESAERS